MKKKIILVTLISLLILTGCSTKENRDVLETNGMLSYTIDGESTNEQPSKESGYIVNKIICDSDIDLMWDNDNWEVEFTNITYGKCTVDFTKDKSTQGYRITVISNNPSSLDSLNKATVENGTVKIYSKSKIESVTGCNGIVEDNKIIVSNITENQTCNVTVVQTLKDKILDSYPPKSGRTEFTTIDNGIPALYTDKDDQGPTYYFSGDGTDMRNWVSFAGSLWRVIRINGNGSVRLLYAGTGGEDGYIGSPQAYNTSYNHPGYVGWKYSLGDSLDAIRGNANKSDAYTTVENWYNALSSTDKNYIDGNAIYCNDRGLASGNSFSTSSQFYYAVRGRLNTDKTPTLECSNTTDRFYNFGLMTADEVLYAGGVNGTNSPKAYYYLNASGGSSTGRSYWWTMSPFDWNSSNAFVFVMCGSSAPGYLGHTDVNLTYVVRPVVSLKPCVEYENGDGSANSPYKLSISDKCTGYKVTTNVTNGYISTSNNTKRVEHGGTTEFLIEPNENYNLKGATVTGGCTLNETTGILTASNVTSEMICNVLLKGKTLKERILLDNPKILERTDFSTAFTSNNTSTLYKETGNFTEDGKDVYYFAGNAQNNWVQFGQDKDGNNMYWRIIRTNEDDSVRMLFVGGSMSTTFGFIGTKSVFNTTHTNPRYVGYMYGSAGSLEGNRKNTTNSAVKTVVDDWYKTSLNTRTDGTYTYDKYVSETAIYCNDRSTPSYSATTSMDYAPAFRLSRNKRPSYKCGNNEKGDLYSTSSTLDKFTKSTKTGNGQLIYPVGLMTADEVSYAGGLLGSISPHTWYYYNSIGTSVTGTNSWWLMSPVSSSGGYVQVTSVNNQGALSSTDPTHTYAIRPVISLKSCVEHVSGDGSADSPYMVKIDEICSISEN